MPTKIIPSMDHATAAVIPEKGRIIALDQLSTSILHDLRNPLASICGCSEMLMDLELTPEQVKRLSGNIHQAAGRMRELLGNLFDVTQGKIAAAEPCSIPDMITRACEFSAAAARDQRIEISLDLQVDKEIQAVRGRMERVFINLVTNAVEAMPRGGRILISAKETTGFAFIEVEDSGPGIPPEIQDRLFEPLFLLARKTAWDWDWPHLFEPSAITAEKCGPSLPRERAL